eukprot:scaffold263474_cov24-Tisochrysis_lutea.AAC.1
MYSAPALMQRLSRAPLSASGLRPSSLAAMLSVAASRSSAASAVEDSGEQPPSLPLVVVSQAKRLKGAPHLAQCRLITLSLSLERGRRVGAGVEDAERTARGGWLVRELQLGRLERLQACEQCVEDVVVALSGREAHDARLLEQEGGEGGGAQLGCRVVLEHEELAVARRIIVHDGACVAKRLEHTARVAERLMEPLRSARAADRRRVRQVLQQPATRLRFAGARLARYEDRLRATVEDATEGVGCDGKGVGRGRRACVARVALEHVVCVQPELRIRVEREEHLVDIRVDASG